MYLLTALLFGVSSVAHAHAMTGAVMTVPSAVMDMSSPDHDMGGCGGDKAAQTSCIAACATAAAILSTPVLLMRIAAVEERIVPADIRPPESAPFPEPHPPKSR